MVVTIFPEYLEPLKLSLLGKAREKGLVDLHLHDLRETRLTVTARWMTPRTAVARAW